ILSKNDIILADEPTGSLDTENSNLILNQLKKLNSEGKTIVMVSHDKNAFSYCSRIIDL
ncbi:MAG TPA: bacteriocin ABC transporter ATP-binding protein, partial [Exiguobacterium sp.]|nr:bacteriocin ABC transporter ATP-binding protein [Exiguobacterium sp.]